VDRRGGSQDQGPRLMTDNGHDLQGARVLVAGGAGFVGSQLVRELLDVGARVVVYDNFLHGRQSHLDEVRDRIDVVVGDILDEWKLIEAFRIYHPTYAFDLVGDTYVPTAYDVPKRFFRINVEGTLNILMAARNFDVRRVLYVSTTEVYGEARTVPMTEEHPLDPYNTYAVSKLAADRLCFTFFKEHGVPVIIARIYNSYGPRETEPYIVPEIVTQLAKGPVVRLGNLKAQRDLTFVADTAKGLIAALCSPIPNGEAVNVGSGRAYSVEDLVQAVAEAMGLDDYRVEIDPRRLRHHDIQLFLSDSTKLREASGWSPRVDLREGLRLTVDWFNAHGKRWCWEEWVEGPLLYDAAGG
jgi:nucleoside-diphosphate-sugar epimerase